MSFWLITGLAFLAVVTVIKAGNTPGARRVRPVTRCKQTACLVCGSKWRWLVAVLMFVGTVLLIASLSAFAFSVVIAFILTLLGVPGDANAIRVGVLAAGFCGSFAAVGSLCSMAVDEWKRHRKSLGA